MELKTARLTLLIDPHKKAAFEHLCAQRDLTASQVVRQMIRDYLLEHGVGYTPSGQDAPTAPAPVQPPAPKRRATAVRSSARTAANASAPHKARRKA